jgi:histone-arginine methyltransferase CARM1
MMVQASRNRSDSVESQKETSSWKKFGQKAEEITPHKKNTSNTLTKKKTEEEEQEEVDKNPFSQYYGMLIHQQNMLQDHVRTSTYQRAMLENEQDFQGKIVLDVGTGSGILAYFAIQAGAKHVYAVELSNMADCAREIMAQNGLQDKITILKGKMEEIELPDHVDIVISEPMGFFLVHERMLETYVNAGKKWRRANNPHFKMFPSIGTMYMAPFSDESIYREQMNKVAFWQQKNFYGLNLTCMASKSIENHFFQPIVGYFPSNILLTSQTATHVIDFKDVTQKELQTFDYPFSFIIEKTGKKKILYF